MADLKEWSRYENLKLFCSGMTPSFFKTVETNLDFYQGNQWRNVKSNDMPTPVFNIIKRALDFFVSSVCSQKITVKFEPLEHRNDDSELQDDNGQVPMSAFATSEVNNLFDKLDIDYKIRQALTDAGICGDCAAHIYFNKDTKPYNGMFGDIKGEIELELVDATNVFFGNPNLNKVENQPYIILSGRSSVEKLQQEMKARKDIASDTPDADMAGQYGKQEVMSDEDDKGKATYILYYYKKKINQPVMTEDGRPVIDETGEQEINTETHVFMSKLVQNAYIFKDIDTGLSEYPIAWLQWETTKNNYHGQALATFMIPNQIFINKMYAMVMYNLMTTAFPKIIYNKNAISKWSNKIGQAIGVEAENVNTSVKAVSGASMSTQIQSFLEVVYQRTMDSLGINDTLMGQINPEQASGKSITAVVQQSQVPLENQKARLYQWVKDIARIMLDMMGTYYGTRPVFVNTLSGTQMYDFNFSLLKNEYYNCICDVGASSYWSETAGLETLSNLLQQNFIDPITFIENVPNGYIPNRQKILEKLKQEKAEQEAMQQQMAQNQAMLNDVQNNIQNVNERQ